MSLRRCCPKCGQTTRLELTTCWRCGYAQFAPLPTTIPQSQPNTPVITAMWVCAGAAVLLALTGTAAGFAMGVLLDIPAFVMAIFLVSSNSPADKSNGWAKLTLESIAFVIGFLSAMHR